MALKKAASYALNSYVILIIDLHRSNNANLNTKKPTGDDKDSYCSLYGQSCTCKEANIKI